MLTRRDFLRLTGSAAPLALFPSAALALASPTSSGGPRLFFSPAEVPRIRAAAASAILAPVVDAWAGGRRLKRDLTNC